MRLVPRTLFGRLTLLLVVLLSVAQLLSAAAHFYDRNHFLLHAAGLNSADRIAGIARLLDMIAPAKRPQAIRSLDVPPLHVTLDDAQQTASTHYTGAANAMARLLKERLGPGFRVNVTVHKLATTSQLSQPLSNDPPWAATMHQRITSLLSPGLAYASYGVQVRLRDGQDVQFDYHLPADLFAWRWRLVASLAILLVSAAFVAWLAVRWMIRPLELLARAADDLGKDIEHPPLAESGPEEVATAARAFNRMQQRLTRFIGDRARVLAAVSHDLKTPITRLRLRAAMLDDETLQQKIQTDLDEMEAMVIDSLEFLRGMESGEPVQQVDIIALVESMQNDAEDMGQTFEFQAKPTPPFRGRPLALKRCIGNLVQNALAYGNQVTVRLRDSAESIQIIVEDRGPGIADELHAQVFEPFFRVEPSRNRSTGGTGLGLAIARNIARGHGGDIMLYNRAEGGLQVTVTLPR